MMTVDVTGSRQADLLVKKSHDLGLVVSNIGQDMRSERWTDVTLYSRERIPLSVHRFILWQSPYLQTILRSQSCCRGQCGHQSSISILLPDVSYPHLLQVINFLYTGLLQSSQRDRDHILVIIASSELRDNIIIQSLVELLGFGSNISVDTSEDQEIVIEDEDDIALDISNGDGDASFPESRGNVSSPSHSGGITSPEVDPLQDFETDSEDDSSEDVRTNDVNALEIEDPYLFIASPVVSRGIENKRKEKRKVKSSEPSQQSGSARDKKCKNCKVRVSALTFKKHIVTHLYDKWPEVGPDTTHCNLCDKTLQGQKYLINHLATVHHQLEEKLAEDGETVESYEMEIVEETGADSVDTVSNNLVQAMELEPSVLFTGEENRESPGDDNDSDATVPCSPRNCDDSISDDGD